MKIGIAIDAWKETIFHRRLTVAGFTYTKLVIGTGAVLLAVESNDRVALLRLVSAANTEAANTSKP